MQWIGFLERHANYVSALATQVASQPLTRFCVLIAVVLGTIWIIGILYGSGRHRVSVGLRPTLHHSGASIFIPRNAISSALDLTGIQARVRIFYLYKDTYGKEQRECLYANKLKVWRTETRLRSKDAIFGHEPVDVPIQDVIIPPLSNIPRPELLSPCPASASEYVYASGYLEKSEDDTADLPIVLVPESIFCFRPIYAHGVYYEKGAEGGRRSEGTSWASAWLAFVFEKTSKRYRELRIKRRIQDEPDLRFN